jgi:hypothetical protein
MSQLVLDDQLDTPTLLPPIRKWITAQRLRDLRPNQRILDERVPEILLTRKQPTFVTIDQDFWDRHLCHPSYCILYFALRSEEQGLIPDLVRALLRRPDFRSRARRMGKVARISTSSIDYWQFQVQDLQQLAWTGAARRKR